MKTAPELASLLAKIGNKKRVWPTFMAATLHKKKIKCKLNVLKKVYMSHFGLLKISQNIPILHIIWSYGLTETIWKTARLRWKAPAE